MQLNSLHENLIYSEHITVADILPAHVDVDSLESVIFYLFEKILSTAKVSIKKNLILNCEGIINKELTDFIFAFEKNKRIKPSVSLNIEASRLANAIAAHFKIEGSVETFLMPFSTSFLKKRLGSILGKKENESVIFCDIYMVEAKWYEINIEIYNTDSVKSKVDIERIGIAGVGLITAYGQSHSYFINQLFLERVPKSLYCVDNEEIIEKKGKKWLQQVILESLQQAAMSTSIFSEPETAVIICSRAGLVSKTLEEKASGWLGSRKKWLKEFFAIQCDCYEISAACASVGFAITVAKELLESSYYNKIVIIGIEVPSYFELNSLKALKALSNEQSAKPFDSERDGITLGQGGGALILASSSYLKNKNKLPLAWLGISTCMVNYVDRADIHVPHLISLLQKVIGKKKIDAVIAHATGTRKGDLAECEALSTLFSNNSLVVLSIKGAIGHLLYASGFPSVSMAIGIFNKNKFPASLGLKNLDSLLINTPIDFFPEKKIIEESIECILINNFGFFGCYSSFILERAQ